MARSVPAPPTRVRRLTDGFGRDTILRGMPRRIRLEIFRLSISSRSPSVGLFSAPRKKLALFNSSHGCSSRSSLTLRKTTPCRMIDWLAIAYQEILYVSVIG